MTEFTPKKVVYMTEDGSDIELSIVGEPNEKEE